MKISKQGIDLIKKYEGFKPYAYLCPANILTIGYGHTKGVRLGQTCTEAEAEQFLKEDLEIAEAEVNQVANEVELTQGQFDSLVSFTFNLGAGNFKTSTLRKKVLNNPADTTIMGEFGKWVYVKGKVSQGLQRRRLEESKLYFSK
jgi:lysozyme